MLWVILTALVLVAVVTGCDGMWRYDARLVAADSLIHDHPDSALALVEAVAPDSLTREGDRAYRDLLLTQGRYRSYVTATSDSDINRALDYYRRHDGEREKLTRAYIYKGAVMEELGLPDTAMIYYKYAEATAAPDDYFNLGYTNLRIGDLYYNNHSFDGNTTQKYENAAKYMSLANDSLFHFISLNNLGCSYRYDKPQKAEEILLKAQRLAKALNDSMLIFSSAQSLLVLYYYCSRYSEARTLLHQVHPERFQYLDVGLYFCASNVFSKCNKLDSSRLFLDLAKKNMLQDVPLHRIYYLESLGEYALAQGDTVAWLKNNEQSQLIADSLKSNQEKIKLLKIEKSYDERNEILNSAKQHSTRIVLYTIILVVSLLLFAAALWYYNRKHRYDKLIVQLRKECDNQTHDLSHLQQKYDELIINDQGLKEFITAHTAMLRQIIESAYHAPKNALSNEIKQIVKLQDNNSDNWVKLFSYLDNEYHSIMKLTHDNYPQLNNRELLMIALTRLGYTCAQIAIILDYSNATSISTIRKRIAQKMGISYSLLEYVSLFD